MSKFENVTIIKAANVYFDGKVTSRTIEFPDGSTQSLGIMQPGEYEFGTAKREIMDIMSGALSVLLPGKSEWLNIVGGESFEVPANASFKVNVSAVTDYCCAYLDD
ncbi:MAG: pyrimidine/purine nucleoside phosphorylase [Pseudohongiellaceae bacterium]|jgi:uncharacterized protein YaiE (UPF0345 family)